MDRRVVITGLGAVTPCGNSPEELWNSLMAGKHGFTLAPWFPDQEPDNLSVVARVKDFDASEYFDKKELRRNDVIVQYAVYCAMQALKDAGTDLKDIDPYRVGVVIGSGIGGIYTTEEEMANYHNKGNKRVGVFTITKMIGNMHAVTRSTDVDRASIPFDAERSGFVLGDGCGLLVLEEYEHAKARGAKIYAEICGYGSTCDAYHETSPDPEGKGGAMAMKFAYQEAGMKPEDINYINAHGTSTSMNDRTETMAVKEAFGDHAKDIAINSTKSMTGHLLGAAGGVEAVVTAMSIKNSKVHMTLGYKVPDPECDLDYVTEGARDLKITGALSNSLGFGGHNGCICMRPVE